MQHGCGGRHSAVAGGHKSRPQAAGGSGAGRTAAGRSGLQLLRVVAQVVVDKGLDEVVAVVVACMAAQRERLAQLGAGGFQRFGQQLAFRSGTCRPGPGR
jgi:hypothetical protein